MISILILVNYVDKYIQQMTIADNILRCSYFAGALSDIYTCNKDLSNGSSNSHSSLYRPSPSVGFILSILLLWIEYKNAFVHYIMEYVAVPR